MAIREEDYEEEEKLETEGSDGETDEHEESDDTETDSEDVSTESSEEVDEERAAIRERRRLERQKKKEHVKEERETLRRELAARDSIINEMRQRLDVVERKSTGSEAAQIDAAIKQTSDAYGYYKQQVAIAAAASDGIALADAQEKMFQAMRKHEDLNKVKQAYGQRQAQPAALDPRLKNNADTWLKKNTWYNPAGTDTDSRVALSIDNALASEGWDATTTQYWDELDSRLKRYMPHRYESRRDAPSVSKPRVPVSGSGREQGSSASQPYKLSADRVAALKEAGMWENTVAREAAIKQFKQHDKENRK